MWWNTDVHPPSSTDVSSMLTVVHAPRETITVPQQLSVEAAPTGQHAVAALSMFILLLLIYH
jgi:hypothetical protein